MTRYIKFFTFSDLIHIYCLMSQYPPSVMCITKPRYNGGNCTNGVWRLFYYYWYYYYYPITTPFVNDDRGLSYIRLSFGKGERREETENSTRKPDKNDNRGLVNGQITRARGECYVSIGRVGKTSIAYRTRSFSNMRNASVLSAHTYCGVVKAVVEYSIILSIWTRPNQTHSQFSQFRAEIVYNPMGSTRLRTLETYIFVFFWKKS